VKLNLKLLSSLLLLTSAIAQAGPVLIVGTPSDSYSSPAILKPSPYFGGALVNFDSLTASTTFSSYSSSGITISSPDGLEVLPFSTQSGPMELFDNSSNGSADLFINLSQGSSFLGVGIADSDNIPASGNPVTISLQPLTQTGTNLGSAFNVTLTEIGSNPGNGYFVVEHTTSDIYGLKITQSVGNANYSGLAIDDVQAAPEPSSLLLLTAGVAILGLYRSRKMA
jgi:hypothetical protein